MRNLLLIPLFIFISTFCACSFSTDLVLVNLSDRVAQVRYQVKDFPGAFRPPTTPATKGSTEMDDDSPWRELSSDQYRLYPESRTVTVTLMPKSALLIARVRGPGMPDDADAAASFPIKEILVVGAYGKMILQGEQLRKSFTPESKRVYGLTYK